MRKFTLWLSFMASIFVFFCLAGTVSAKALVGNKGDQIVVSIQKGTLYWFSGGELRESFPVVTGRNGKTPLGDFSIKGKLVSPDYTHPITKKMIPGGAPNNPVGKYYMPITNHGVAIHGTNQPWLVDQRVRVSMGCIRMKNEDVGLLFHHVDIGTPVHIIKGAPAQLVEKPKVKIIVKRAVLRSEPHLVAAGGNVEEVLSQGKHLSLLSTKKENHFYHVMFEGRDAYVHESVVDCA